MIRSKSFQRQKESKKCGSSSEKTVEKIKKNKGAEEKDENEKKIQDKTPAKGYTPKDKREIFRVNLIRVRKYLHGNIKEKT